MLSLEKALHAQLDSLLEGKITKAITGEQLVSLIVQIVRSGIVDPSQSIVDLNQEDFTALVGTLKSELAAELKAGLEIRPIEAVSVGFRLSDKDGKSFFDFSAEEIARLMARFLSPAIQEIVFASAKQH